MHEFQNICIRLVVLTFYGGIVGSLAFSRLQKPGFDAELGWSFCACSTHVHVISMSARLLFLFPSPKNIIVSGLSKKSVCACMVFCGGLAWHS